jgi:hypothetical protein
MHDSLRVRVKNAAGKNVVESTVGDDLHRKTGRWMQKVRVIDFAGDHYRELIIDPESGTVVHYQEERLSQHRGHGSAKK